MLLNFQLWCCSIYIFSYLICITLELYINEDENINKDKFIDKYKVFEKIEFFNNNDFQEVWIDFIKVRKKKKAADSERAMKSLANRLLEYSKGSKVTAMEIVRKSAEGGWSDIYPLNNKSISSKRTIIEKDAQYDNL